jgi:4'-phosphopantetheinyl transferase
LTSFELPAGEVHVWEAPLTLGDVELKRLEENLPEDERIYADEFRFPVARRQYLISRGRLRELLSRYLGQAARDIRLVTEGEGKPVIEGNRPVEFNLSHSGDLVLYAVAAEIPVGVDVEKLRPMPRALELAQRFLSPEERDELEAATPEQLSPQFFSMWVRREAYAKARGTSVWRVLERHYHHTSAEVARQMNPSDQMTSGYSVKLVPDLDGYVGAVAAPGNDWRVIRRGRL